MIPSTSRRTSLYLAMSVPACRPVPETLMQDGQARRCGTNSSGAPLFPHTHRQVSPQPKTETKVSAPRTIRRVLPTHGLTVDLEDDGSTSGKPKRAGWIINVSVLTDPILLILSAEAWQAAGPSSRKAQGVEIVSAPERA